MTATSSEFCQGALTKPLQIKVFASPTRIVTGDITFPPVTSTLVLGKSEALLVDTQFLNEDVDALADIIEATGKRLVKIFITHGHADHYFGADRLLARFPDARITAVASVVKYMQTNHPREVKMFSAMFGSSLAIPTTMPEPLKDDVIALEGCELRALEIGQADINPSTALHISDLQAVVTGDITYNDIHQMLGLTGPAEWDKWIESVDKIERLRPEVVVSGHKKLGSRDDEADRILDGTRRYIRDFAAAVKLNDAADGVVAAMVALYPDRGNVTTLHYSANAAMKHKTR